jgi:hypothetical protein
MQAVSRKADKNRTRAPVNPERRRESGWTTLDNLGLRALYQTGKNTPDPRIVRTLNNLLHNYVFAKD